MEKALLKTALLATAIPVAACTRSATTTEHADGLPIAKPVVVSAPMPAAQSRAMDIPEGGAAEIDETGDPELAAKAQR